jgi:hypothetical protein
VIRFPANWQGFSINFTEEMDADLTLKNIIKRRFASSHEQMYNLYDKKKVLSPSTRCPTKTPKPDIKDR